MLCVYEYISYLYSDRFPSNFLKSGHMDMCFQLNNQCLSLKLMTMWKICNLLKNVLTQMDPDDNVVLTLSLSSTLNLPQELCCDLSTELEYQHMLYFIYIIEPTICYRYPNECG